MPWAWREQSAFIRVVQQILGLKFGLKFTKQRLKKSAVEMRQEHQGRKVKELPACPDMDNLLLPLGFPETLWFLPKMCCQPLATPLPTFCEMPVRVGEKGNGGKGR